MTSHHDITLDHKIRNLATEVAERFYTDETGNADYLLERLLDRLLELAPPVTPATRTCCGQLMSQTPKTWIHPAGRTVVERVYRCHVCGSSVTVKITDPDEQNRIRQEVNR